MKKATQIVLLVAGILSIIGAVAWFIGSIYYFVMSGILAAIDAGSGAGDLPDSVVDWLTRYLQQHNFDNLRQAAAALAITGVFYLLFAIFCIPAAILSFKARNKDSKGLYIACIVLGALSATGAATIGGILGLIHLAIDKPQEEQPKEEPKAEEPKAEEPKEEEPKAE